MECNDQERTFHCRTDDCHANKSIVDLADFYCHVRDLPYSSAIDELAGLDPAAASTRPEARSSKGFGSIDDLLEFIKSSQSFHQHVRHHIWHNPEKRAQKVVFKFDRRPDAPAHLNPQLNFHGYFYRGKWFRTRLAGSKEPMPYLWHEAAYKTRIVICRDEGEADSISALGLTAVAVSSVGRWEGAHSKLFRGLDIVLLSDADEDGRQYQIQAKKDLMPLAGSLRILELHRRPTLNAAHLLELIEGADDLLDPWEMPTASLGSFEAIPSFQAEEMLPESLRYHLADLSEDLQCPMDMLAAPALAGLSVLLGRKLTVRPKRSSSEFTVAAPLWCILIADPGQKKTQILKSALAPLMAIEESMEQQNKDLVSRRQADMRLLGARDRDLESRLDQATRQGQLATQESLRDDLSKLEQERADLAAIGPRQYIMRDATSEKMLEILVQNPNGVMQLADEVPGWWRSLSTSYVDMRKLFLEGWGGLKILVQRKSYSLRGESILSVVGGAQPDWLVGILRDFKKEGRGNDGLINRFSLLINHEPPLGIWRYVDRPINPEAKRWYDVVFMAFHELTTADVIYGWQKGQPNSICFTPAAQDIFIEWITEKENSIRKGGYSRLLSSHVSKYTSLYASLALIFHLILHFEGKTEEAEKISDHAALLARRWCDYLWFHAKRTFSGTDSQPLPARTMARLISLGDLNDRTSTVDLLTHAHMHLSNEKELSEALRLLSEKKIVRIEGPENARVIRINPHSIREVHKQS